jgi:hypothetical protein
MGFYFRGGLIFNSHIIFCQEILSENLDSYIFSPWAKMQFLWLGKITPWLGLLPELWTACQPRIFSVITIPEFSDDLSRFFKLFRRAGKRFAGISIICYGAVGPVFQPAEILLFAGCIVALPGIFRGFLEQSKEWGPRPSPSASVG